jgi:outer membrane protein assembly factor BamB
MALAQNKRTKKTGELRRFLRALGGATAAVVVVGSLLYVAGLRVVRYGSGMPHLEFRQSAEGQAAAIEAHRLAQRREPTPTPEPNASESATAESTPEASVVATAAPLVDTGGWTDFRGPSRDGRYAGPPIRTNWATEPPAPLWKQPVGGGYAAFVVGGGRAYTIEQRGNEEVVAAYDPETGRELWTSRWEALFKEFQGGDGPRATPTWSGGRVYALGATGEFRVLDDATGEVVWRKNILDDNGASNIPWGMAAAPLVVDDTVVVQPGGRDGRSVVAYDIGTGARVWSSLDDQAAYASPMRATIAGRDQILVVTALRVAGLAVTDGSLLWELPWRTSFDVNASQPLVIGRDRLFYSSGYGTGATVVEIATNGTGFSVREIWRNIRMKNQFTSSVLHDGYIYGLDESILACVDAATGELQWKGGRYGFGQLVLADGHLIVTTEYGDLALVRATPERHEEIARIAAHNGKTWNHPSFAGRILLVRNLAEMAGFDLRR